jgi:hypothetical protein
MEASMTRWKASAIHLSICALIGLSVLAVILLLWYPEPYFEAMGGKHLLLILLGVDVVLGPLITLIIFNPKKKSLRFDLAVITLVQISALIYGVYTVYQARPVFIVFTIDRFEVVAANEIDPEEQQKVTREEFRSLPLDGPRIVAADRPTDPKERDRILSATFAGFDLQHFPQYYVPYHERTSAVLSRAKPLADLRKVRSEAGMSFVELESEYGARTKDFVFVPMQTRQKELTAVIEPSNGDLIEVLPIDPWL